MNQRIDVSWWLGRGPAPEAFRDLFVDPFNASQDEVHLDLLVLESDARDRTVQALRGDDGPDIVMVPRAGDFVSLTREGLLVDLEPYAARHGWRDRLLAPAAGLADLDGRLFGFPRSLETMLLLSNRAVLAELGSEAPRDLTGLEQVAERALRSGVTPFAAGCGDLPESCELLWTLVVNHHAGPDLVRAALEGRASWSHEVFVDAVEQLVSWFGRGWLGTDYFTQTIYGALDTLVDGAAAMAPAMTGMLPPDTTALGAGPFPSLRPAVPGPVFVLGTASMLGISARSAVPDGAARVLDALLDVDVCRRFGELVPGDWNIPLVEGSRAGTPALVTANTGLADAVSAGRAGWATWSFFPPRSEALVSSHVPLLAEGSLSARAHLAQLQDVMSQERQDGPFPGLVPARD